MLLMLKWHGQTSFAELMYIIPGGFGAGVSGSTTFIQLTAGVGASDIAVAGTSHYLTQNLGMVAGLSAMTTILQGTLRPALAQGLCGVPHKQKVTLLSTKIHPCVETDQSVPSKVIEESISNIRYVQSLEGDLKKVVVHAYIQSLTYTHGIVWSSHAREASTDEESYSRLPRLFSIGVDSVLCSSRTQAVALATIEHRLPQWALATDGK